MTQLADAGAFVALPELGVEDAGEAVPLLQPANATTKTSAATQRIATACRIRFSLESLETGSTLVIRRRGRAGSPPKASNQTATRRPTGLRISERPSLHETRLGSLGVCLHT
jgi:hypothetical protein